MPPIPYDHDHENEVIPFGETNFRGQRRKFGIKTDDRRRHVYVIGKTGMGKTTLLENMVLADIYAGHGVAYIDPHGDTADKFLDYIPPHRLKDVVYFNPADMEFPVGFNILEIRNENQKHLVAGGLMGVFKKIWPDVWSPRMEYILLNCVLALLDTPGSTLLGISRILADKDYRKTIVGNVKDPIVKAFWLTEFAKYTDKFASEAIAPVQNKVGQFLSAAIIRNIVAQEKSTIDIRKIMDERKIFIVNLSKGLIGEDSSRLLGGMLITRLQLAAMERVDMPESERQDFYLYVDEFQNFATESFANILSEARKYRLNLITAHQYIEQLDETVAAAVFGNVGTIISFRVGANDAEHLAKEFAPVFTEEDIINLAKYDVYLKLMIDGVASSPFSASTLPPIAKRTGLKEQAIDHSRKAHALTRADIEEKVNKWSGFAEGSLYGMSIKPGASGMTPEGHVAPGAPASAERPYKANCPRCGKELNLMYPPDPSRPFYCKTCKPLVDAEKAAARAAGAKPAAARPAPSPKADARPPGPKPAPKPPRPEARPPKPPAPPPPDGGFGGKIRIVKDFKEDEKLPEKAPDRKPASVQPSIGIPGATPVPSGNHPSVGQTPSGVGPTAEPPKPALPKLPKLPPPVAPEERPPAAGPAAAPPGPRDDHPIAPGESVKFD